MRERLELAHRGRVERLAFEAFQPWHGQTSEHAALQIVFALRQTQAFSFGDEPREVDVRGQVAFTKIRQHVAIHAMLLVTADGALGAGVGIKLVCIEAVVGDEDAPAKRCAREIANPREHGEVDFQRVTRFEVMGEVLCLLREFGAGKIACHEAKCLRAIFLDVELAPAFAAPAHEMHGESIGKLVAEEKGVFGPGLQRSEIFHPLHAISEPLCLRFAVTRIWFHDEIAQRFVAKISQNVFRELSVMRALFDDREICRLALRLPFLKRPHGQQHPEQRPDTHTGEEIALPADSAWSCAIIAMLRMIKRQFHDLRKGQPPRRRGGEVVTENLGQGRHRVGKQLARIVKGG